MKKLSLVALAIAATFSSTAFAGDKSHGYPSPTGAHSTSEAESNSVGIGIGLSQSTATSHGGNAEANGGNSTSTANGGSGGAGGNADSDASSSSGGNSLTSISNGVRSAPSVFAPSVWPTAACQGGISIGGSGPGGGGALGFGWTKKECATVVLAQNLQALGYHKEACEALMSTPSAKRVWPDENKRPKCAPVPVKAEPPHVVIQPATYEGPSYGDLNRLETRFDEKLDRAFKQKVSK